MKGSALIACVIVLSLVALSCNGEENGSKKIIHDHEASLPPSDSPTSSPPPKSQHVGVELSIHESINGSIVEMENTCRVDIGIILAGHRIILPPGKTIKKEIPGRGLINLTVSYKLNGSWVIHSDRQLERHFHKWLIEIPFEEENQ